MRPEPPAAGSVGALLTGFALKATFAWARGSIEAERISGRSIQRQVLNPRTWIPDRKPFCFKDSSQEEAPGWGPGASSFAGKGDRTGPRHL